MGDMAFDHVKGKYDLDLVSFDWAMLFKRLDGRRPKNLKPLARGGLGWKKALRKLERYMIYVYVSYKDGGIYSVFRKIAKKLLVIL